MPRTSRASRSSTGGGSSHTPTVSAPKVRTRPPSPLSPTRVTRLEEKKEMQNLNDRLAIYIEQVRRQEIEISGLQHQLATVEETRTSETVTLRDKYDTELNYLRLALDNTSKERAKMEIEKDKWEKEALESKRLLREKERALEAKIKEVKNLTARINQLQGSYDQDELELQELRPECVKLRKKLEDAKKNLEDETLQRVDLQNKLQSLQEKGKFENDLLEHQLSESKVRRQMEISEIDGKLQSEFDLKLATQIAELRATHEAQQKHSRDEFNRLYEEKMKSLQSKLDAARQGSAGSKQEMQELEMRISGLSAKNSSLENKSLVLSRKIEELEEEMDRVKQNFRAQLALKDEQLKSKQEELDELAKDFQALLETKLSLDMEIATYRKLLEGEEDRLGLSPTGSPVTSPTGRGIKRKRTTLLEEDVTELTSDHSGKGNIVIQPLNKEGKYIEIKNTSGVEKNIGGWTLVNITEGEDVSYKFHRSTTLQPGDVCTVWSSDTREEHNPPLNLVMKKGGWEIGDENMTTMRNKDGEEEAVRKSYRERSITGTTRYGTSQMYSQGLEANGDEKQCAIM